jgi:hypothetical protein
MKTFWTIGGATKATPNGDVELVPGKFDTLAAASMAWERAGKPQARGSSVWATEHSAKTSETLRTVTLAK